MPLLRINAGVQGLRLHGSDRQPLTAARRLRGPVVVMIHGNKYSPRVAGHCPHARLFHAGGWPQALGLEAQGTNTIAFGWEARGGLRHAHAQALSDAAQLAQLIAALRGRRHGGPVHIIAHSLGATLALAALPYLRHGDVGRIVLLSGAAHLGLARHALASPAGLGTQLFHVTSRANALFDLGFEQVIAGTGAIGRGIDRAQAVRLHIDCARTRGRLGTLGYPLGPPRRRVCHWSSYTCAGVMALNAALLDGSLPMTVLRHILPPPPERRTALAILNKTSIMAAVSHWHRART